MNTEFKNPFAEIVKPDSGEMIFPDQAYEMKAKDENISFYCPENNCTDPDRILFIKKSSLGNVYFSHRQGYEDHTTAPETLLHKLAIKWFEGKSIYEVPLSNFITVSLLNIDADKTVTEYNFLKTIIPDVKLTTTNDFEFAVEIFVTNDISDEKMKLIQNFGLPTLRVDLSDFYKKYKTECRDNIKFVQGSLDFLMTDIKIKKWVFPVPEKAKEEKSGGNMAWRLLAFLGLGIGVLLFIRNRIRKRKR